MSQLEQYPLEVLVPVHGGSIEPGVMVRHVDWGKTLGTVVSLVDDQALVLWARSPGLFGFGMPHVRRVFPSMIANELVKVQPMTLPSGLIFYMNYTYGSGSMPTSGSV